MTTSDGVIIPRKIPPEIWDWYNLKGDCMILVLHFVVGVLLLTLIELEVVQWLAWCPKLGCKSSGDRRRQGPKLVKDDDVIGEENRVAIQGAQAMRNSVAKGSTVHARADLVDTIVTDSTGRKVDPNHVDCIRVHNFQKEYDTTCGAPVRAVKKASFGLDYGECFALLGVNGAGKSTTFKSLTREITPTTGEITI